jgi:hypothetical protein
MEKITGQCRDLVRFLVERKMARFENAGLRFWQIPSIDLGFSYLERRSLIR